MRSACAATLAVLASAACERARPAAELTRLTLSASRSPAPEGLPVQITAHLGARAAAAGRVSFASDGAPLGSAPVLRGAASILVALPHGRHTVTAVYWGDLRHDPAGAALKLPVAPAAASVLWSAQPGAGRR